MEVRKLMYAVIETGGKQYKVTQGDVIHVEKLDNVVGDEVTFECLFVGGAKKVLVGDPIVKGAKVTGVVKGQVKGEKIVVYKYKAKKNYRKKQGHRQNYTRIEITGVAAK